MSKILSELQLSAVQKIQIRNQNTEQYFERTRQKFIQVITELGLLFFFTIIFSF